MKIVSALGGGGSTFVLRALERHGYTRLFGAWDPYPNKVRLERYPALINWYHLALRLLGSYRGDLRVLKRPDSFWTDWPYHPQGVYDPGSDTFQHDLLRHRDYIVRTRHARSAGLAIRSSDLSTESLASLVASYLNTVNRIESRSRFTAVLIAGHWGEYGIFKELGVQTTYVIRDPFNSLISHSKSVRHEKDYLRRGLQHINTREWIDCYLEGPHHYWINHARSALEQENAAIVRYNHFAEDWKEATDLPDISSRFVYSENDVRGILTPESIDYIHGKTRDLCRDLDLGTDRYV